MFKTIKMGDKGPNVLEAQRLLKKAGSAICTTGIFTIGMLSAVKAFQRKNGLNPTGKIDSRTMKKLSALKTKKK